VALVVLLDLGGPPRGRRPPAAVGRLRGKTTNGHPRLLVETDHDLVGRQHLCIDVTDRVPARNEHGIVLAPEEVVLLQMGLHLGVCEDALNGRSAHHMARFGGFFHDDTLEHPTFVAPQVCRLSASEPQHDCLISGGDACRSAGSWRVFERLDARICSKPALPQADGVPRHTQLPRHGGARVVFEEHAQHDSGPHNQAGGGLSPARDGK
jgi:hypothetical protein